MEKKRMSWGSAIKEFVARAFDFNGRSSRAAYWWVELTLFVIYGPILIFAEDFNSVWIDRAKIFEIVTGLILLVPMFSLTIRRLRDVGMRPVYAYSLEVSSLALTIATDLMSNDTLLRFPFLNWLSSILYIIEFMFVLRPSAQVDQS